MYVTIDLSRLTLSQADSLAAAIEQPDITGVVVAIEPGDPLGPSIPPLPSAGPAALPLTGTGVEDSPARRLDPATPGAVVLGRALEPLVEGTGLIWVLVLG